MKNLITAATKYVKQYSEDVAWTILDPNATAYGLREWLLSEIGQELKAEGKRND